MPDFPNEQVRKFLSIKSTIRLFFGPISVREFFLPSLAPVIMVNLWKAPLFTRVTSSPAF